MDDHEALAAMHALRNNVIGTQNAGWSNLVYPMVAILGAAGYEYQEPTEQAMREHLATYGGAGGYPGHVLREVDQTWCEPVGKLKGLTTSVRKYLDDPNAKNRSVLEEWLIR